MQSPESNQIGIVWQLLCDIRKYRIVDIILYRDAPIDLHPQLFLSVI